MNSESSTHQALATAIEAVGSQSAFARLCNVGQPAVWKWLNNALRLPPEHVLKVEAATGISRHDLRPDIYPRDEHFAPSPPVAPATINNQCDPRPVSQSARPAPASHQPATRQPVGAA